MAGVVPFTAAVGRGRPVNQHPALFTLDEAVARVCDDAPDGRVALLKIDCEGGEWPALAGATDLTRVDRVIGEWHRVKWDGRKWGPADLAGLLERHGLAVTVGDTAGDCGLFTASRRDLSGLPASVPRVGFS